MAIFRGTQSNNRLAGGAAGDLMYGYGGNDTLLGNNGNDTLYGDAGSDVLRGGAGADVIYDNATERTAANGSLNLHNVLDGGIGDDILSSKTTVLIAPTNGIPTAKPNFFQELLGGAGNDKLYADIGVGSNPGASWVPDILGTVRLDGGDGNDKLTVSSSNNEWMMGWLNYSFGLNGGRGNDSLELTLTGGAIDTVKAVLDGGDGNDIIRADIASRNYISSEVDMTVNGGAGNDDILLKLDPDTGDDFTAASLTCNAGIGDDHINIVAKAAGASLTIDAGAGNDVVVIDSDGTEGAANVMGSARSSVLGGDGNDSVTINLIAIVDVDNSVSGGKGNDTIAVSATNWSFPYQGGHLSSVVLGNDGNDVLRVSLDADPQSIPVTSLLDGGTGNDTLAGSSLADALIGGTGADQMTGGTGNDTFVLDRDTSGADGALTSDIVTDFTVGADHFDLGAFSLSLAGLQALLAASSGDTLALTTIGGRDVVLAGLDVHDLTASDFIL